jgi:chemotaxis protein methyltransferase CheR
MKHTLAHSALSQLSEMIAAKTALHFPEERWDDLEQKVSSSAKEFGFNAKEEFIQWLLSSPLTTSQMDILASHLTIHETYFWREPQVFEALVTQVLPALVRSRENTGRHIRIWSAGCATGEEPYSIAIALRRAIPILKEWNITILATDINPQILRKAMTVTLIAKRTACLRFCRKYGRWSPLPI